MIKLEDLINMPIDIPTKEELHVSCLEKYNTIKHTFLDAYPQVIMDLSFPTKFIRLDTEMMLEAYNVVDDSYLTQLTTHLISKLDAEMGWRPHFIRLSTRSPKDVEEKPITCSGKQALCWILNSERCLDDINMARHAKQPIYICLREADYIHPYSEFRCFAKDGRFLGVSRYHYRDKPDVTYDLPLLFDACKGFYDTHLKSIYPDIVFDLAYPGTDRVKLIELNPYGRSDPCLFGDYTQVELGGARV